MNTFTKNNVTFTFEQPLSIMVGKYTLQDFLERWQTDLTDPKELAEDLLKYIDNNRNMLGSSFEEFVVKRIIDDFAHNPRLRTKKTPLPTEHYQWEDEFSYDQLVRLLQLRSAPSIDPTNLIDVMWVDMISNFVDKSIYNEPSRMSYYSPRVLEALEKWGTVLVLTTGPENFELFSFEIDLPKHKIYGTYAGFGGKFENFAVDVYPK